MINALAYLQYHSFRNRMVTRIKRLRQPKYLVGAIIGGIYFYFYFYRYVFAGIGRQALASASPANGPLFQSLGALALLVIVVFAWLIPQQRAALIFSEAEVAFLFPAPVSRRTLIHFKLLRSQMRILFTAFLLLIFTNHSGHPWLHAAGWWIVLSTLNLHFLGCSFARTMLLDRGISNRTRRLVVFGLALAFAAVVILWSRKTFPSLNQPLGGGVEAEHGPLSFLGLGQIHNLNDLRAYAMLVLTSGPMPYLLYPFRLVVRPFFASDAATFLGALGPALLVLAAHYAWVVLADTAFEEASVEASQKQAEKLAHVRAGNWQLARGKLKRARAPFVLRPAGFPPIALLWKNLISVGQAFTLRMWIRLLVIAAIFFVYSISQHSGPNGASSVVGTMAGMLLAWSLLLGPRLLRQDLRQDLLMVDVLKTFPLRGWQIVLGEILAPVVVLSAVQWLLLILTAGFFYRAGGHDRAWVLAIAAGAVMVLPTVDLILILGLNTAAMLFPAWMQIGKDAPRGVEATGQRLIFLLGQWLLLAVALLPAAAVFLIIFIPLRLAVSAPAAVPFASLAGALVIAGEGALGLMLLGRIFERFDLSKELGT